MRLALYQPDIPQNAGAMLRMAACLAVGVDVIEPCGFVWSDRHLRRAGMDYMDRVALVRHTSWRAFLASRGGAAGRLVLLTTAGVTAHTAIAFQPGDTLIVGRESAGAPGEVHDAADARILVPMAAGSRSLNVALAAAIVLGEALRQTGGFPGQEKPELSHEPAE